MERGVGFAAGDLAKALSVAKAEVSPIVDDMGARGMLVAETVGRVLHYFVVGSQPGAQLTPKRRPAPMESFADICESSYCADFTSSSTHERRPARRSAPTRTWR
ncbi:hypothetical protein DF156_10400 [Burkholderia ubonensis]|uniref:MarR family transcriptional regulator n=2 Tax=Burkholderia ubonensis TaxID=101571 RepID=A0AB74D9B4_9BURK|nr:hypothetical protein CJO71_02730 [Burkholderia ubonensis]PAJ84724.1 hypothetical protein CJO70_26485 [Burkholderia ubonensis]PAJ95351.1 hypothetical protein CJO69_07165 [Burkholderia ubonensis]PAJ97011.1 hypothetical protein CJO68_32400 [Burkholderia ubonensis]PAK09640.1 hypothetical protein CJO67_00750 [Burkholderia ubonensis]